MNPNQIPFGEQTANEPTDSLDNAQPAPPTEFAAEPSNTPPASEPQTPNQPIEPQPSPTATPVAPEPEKKKKNLLPIIIAVAAIVVAIAIIVAAIVLSNTNNTEQPAQENPEASEHPTTEEPSVETEYIAKERLTKREYTVDDLNSGITFDKEGNYTFTASSSVKFKHASSTHAKDGPEDTGVILQVFVTHDDLSNVPISIELTDQTIENLDASCTETKGCESDYIDGAKTLFISRTKTDSNKKTSVSYEFYSKSDNKLLKYRSINSYPLDSGIKEAIMRNIMVKAAMTMSGKSEKPNVYDVATFFKIPNNKRVKSYKNILEVDHQLIKIQYQSDKNINNMFVFLKHLEGVAITDASQKPKIGGFMYNNLPGFRFYNGDEFIDVICSTQTATNSKEDYVKEVQKAIEIIDKIDE